MDKQGRLAHPRRLRNQSRMEPRRRRRRWHPLAQCGTRRRARSASPSRATAIPASTRTTKGARGWRWSRPCEDRAILSPDMITDKQTEISAHHAPAPAPPRPTGACAPPPPPHTHLKCATLGVAHPRRCRSDRLRHRRTRPRMDQRPPSTLRPKCRLSTRAATRL